MPIIMTLDVMLARRKMKGKDLAGRIGISETQLSLLRSGKVKGMRFATLSRLCAVLDCKPGDIIEYEYSEADLAVDDGEQVADP
jgi:putative transcriptional regulator